MIGESAPVAGGDQILLRRMRAHANYTETVPMVSWVMAAAELSAVPIWALWAGALSLPIGRLMHVAILILKDWGLPRAHSWTGGVHFRRRPYTKRYSVVLTASHYRMPCASAGAVMAVCCVPGERAGAYYDLAKQCPLFQHPIAMAALHKKILLPGGAGLVGQNLVARLVEAGYENIVVLDKHQANLQVLQAMQPRIIAEWADLAETGSWQRHFEGADVVVMLQAQIGGHDYGQFVRNNVDSTRLILDQVKQQRVTRLIHVSSSVVQSASNDYYTTTKKAQERLVIESGIVCPILRPTLMFGWFDRKHLGWLARFMRRSPVFPVPGHGRYMRQPLYAGDFCNIILSCVSNRAINGVFNISGHEKVDYIDLIRGIKAATRARAVILNVPYTAFYWMLWLWGVFDRNPPFTTQQLTALIARDEFEVIDWPTIFQVSRTSLQQALHETFNHPRFSEVALDF